MLQHKKCPVKTKQALGEFTILADIFHSKEAARRRAVTTLFTK